MLPRPCAFFVGLAALLSACHGLPMSKTSVPTERLYTVNFGDSLWGIASMYGVRGGYMAIARSSHLRDPDFILAGQKLRVPTEDPSLPLPARLTSAPARQSCAVQAVGPRATSLSGCREAACVETARGGRVCSCVGASPESDALLVIRPGSPPVSVAADGYAPGWFDAESAPESPRHAKDLVGVRVQLDADAALETVVAWRSYRGDLGQTQATALVVDDDGRPGPSFQADNFGDGSLVRAGDRCDVLATEWEMADQPGWQGFGWYLGGREFVVDGGALRPSGASLTMRRLFQSFHPGTTGLGGVLVGTPGRDLGDAHAFSRTTEPSVELTRVDRRVGTVTGAQVIAAQLNVSLDGTATLVGPNALTRRLGDRATGTLYPTGYLPADDRALRGKPYTLDRYLTFWGEEMDVLWL